MSWLVENRVWLLDPKATESIKESLESFYEGSAAVVKLSLSGIEPFQNGDTAIKTRSYLLSETFGEEAVTLKLSPNSVKHLWAAVGSQMTDPISADWNLKRFELQLVAPRFLLMRATFKLPGGLNPANEDNRLQVEKEGDTISWAISKFVKTWNEILEVIIFERITGAAPADYLNLRAPNLLTVASKNSDVLLPDVETYRYTQHLIQVTPNQNPAEEAYRFRKLRGEIGFGTRVWWSAEDVAKQDARVLTGQTLKDILRVDAVFLQQVLACGAGAHAMTSVLEKVAHFEHASFQFASNRLLPVNLFRKLQMKLQPPIRTRQLRGVVNDFNSILQTLHINETEMDEDERQMLFKMREAYRYNEMIELYRNAQSFVIEAATGLEADAIQARTRWIEIWLLILGSLGLFGVLADVFQGFFDKEANWGWNSVWSWVGLALFSILALTIIALIRISKRG